MRIASADARLADSPARRVVPMRRVLAALAIASIAIAVIGFLLHWPHLWVLCGIAGVIMLLDLRLRSIARRHAASPETNDVFVRRRVVAAIVIAMALIAIAVAASFFEAWGWRIVGVGSLVAFALMTLIAMPLLAASAHDASSAASGEKTADSTMPRR